MIQLPFFAMTPIVSTTTVCVLARISLSIIIT